MTTKGTCPACSKAVQVKTDGTLKQHTKTEEWPGVIVRRRCTGSGLPPLGPWPMPGHGGHKVAGAAK